MILMEQMSFRTELVVTRGVRTESNSKRDVERYIEDAEGRRRQKAWWRFFNYVIHLSLARWAADGEPDRVLPFSLSRAQTISVSGTAEQQHSISGRSHAYRAAEAAPYSPSFDLILPLKLERRSPKPATSILCTLCVASTVLASTGDFVVDAPHRCGAVFPKDEGEPERCVQYGKRKRVALRKLSVSTTTKRVEGEVREALGSDVSGRIRVAAFQEVVTLREREKGRMSSFGIGGVGTSSSTVYAATLSFLRPPPPPPPVRHHRIHVIPTDDRDASSSSLSLSIPVTPCRICTRSVYGWRWWWWMAVIDPVLGQG
ncbi:hypothetical protein R3P38DRAFT_2808534 [Favolaschia claudopus]|uniref:Uncharacterized protein n=1 Tax=Favolaschia claudopus TaxID=2862362 RepID=A0AAV9ZGA1_9AGAR